MASEEKLLEAFFGKIAPAKDEKKNPKIFLYGLPGSGKTHFVGSCAKVGRTLLLKAEEGALSIADTDVETFPLTGGKGIQAMLDFAIRMLDTAKGREAYDIVALDTLTSAQEEVISDLKARKGGKSLTLQEWGSVIDWTSGVLRRLSQLPQTVVVICHSKDIVIESDDGATMLVRPSLTGKKLVNSASAHYDISAYCTRQQRETEDGGLEVSYVCLTQHPSEVYTVKDRTGRLDRVEVNDFSVWHQKIHAEEGAGDDG